MKSRRYRHQPIRRVHIPKGNGKTRPIGVSPAGGSAVGERSLHLRVPRVHLLLGAFSEGTVDDEVQDEASEPETGHYVRLRVVSAPPTPPGQGSARRALSTHPGPPLSGGSRAKGGSRRVRSGARRGRARRSRG
jgi:hypothetical protein